MAKFLLVISANFRLNEEMSCWNWTNTVGTEIKQKWIIQRVQATNANNNHKKRKLIAICFIAWIFIRKFARFHITTAAATTWQNITTANAAYIRFRRPLSEFLKIYSLFLLVFVLLLALLSSHFAYNFLMANWKQFLVLFH